MPDDQAMFIGFRNPIPEGKALLVPLLNPREVVRGQRARLGDPVLLDLAGQGIRSLSWWRGRYLIIAGEHGEGGTSHLYSWSGQGPAARVPAVDLQGFNAEALLHARGPGRHRGVQRRRRRGDRRRRCKDLEDPAQKRFRGRRVQVPGSALSTGPRPR